MLAGWVVEFGSDPSFGIPTQRVSVAARQLLVGFSRGSMDGSGKSVFIWPQDVGKVWAQLQPEERPRGVMYWNMRNDGGPANGTVKNVSLVDGFNTFLRVRKHTNRTRAV